MQERRPRLTQGDLGRPSQPGGQVPGALVAVDHLGRALPEAHDRCGMVALLVEEAEPRLEVVGIAGLLDPFKQSHGRMVARINPAWAPTGAEVTQ